MIPLEPAFEPTDNDIICARGRSAYNHEGNRRFRSILVKKLEEYKQATTKQQKTVVVVSILDEVQTKSRFVRQSDGQWFEVEAHVAKEKIGQGFRDLLHSRYRSSTKSKVQLRRERRRRQRATACSDGDDNDDDAVNEQISGSAGSEHSQAQGHKRTGSCDNLEPLPLISQRSVESIMYNCPFELVTSQQQSDAFLEGGQEGGNRASENDSFQLHEKKPSPQSEVEDHENNAASAFITPGSLISSLPAITQTNNGNTPDGSASVTHQASSKNFAGAKPLQCIEERGYTQHHYFQPTPPHLLPGFYSGSYPPLPPPSYHGYPGSYCYYPPPTYDPSPYRPGWPPQHVFYAPSPPRRYYSPPSHYSPSAVYLESLAWMRDEEKNSSERFKEDNYDQGSRPCSQGSYFDDLEAQEKENK